MQKGSKIEGHLIVQQCIGEGPTSRVFLCTDTNAMTTLVIKERRRPRQGAAERESALSSMFLSEGAPLPSPIRPTSDGKNLLMPFYKARSAESLSGYLSEEGAWKILRDVSKALCVIHSKGFVHTGICPPSILIADDGSFLLSGLSSLREGTDDSPVQLEERMIPYTAHEAFVNPQKESDIWALGSSVHKLLLGCPIFSGQGGGVQTPSTPLPSLRPDRYSEALSSLLVRCLDYDPEKRPPSETILSEAEKWLQEGTSPSARKRRSTSNGDDSIAPGIDEKDTSWWPDKMRETPKK